MKKNIFILLSMIFTSFLAAQEYGIAVEEHGFAAKLNPSAIGAGNASGISYFQKITARGDLSDEYSLYLTAAPFSYGFDSIYKAPDNSNTVITHQAALGFPLGNGFFSGFSMRWPDSSFNNREYGISGLLRPWNFLSFAAAANDIGGDASSLSAGAGLRPFASSQFWGSRLTFFCDALIDGRLDLSAAGLRAEPVDGISLSGTYNISDRIFSAGINISSRFLSTGVSGNLDSKAEIQGGSFSGFISSKRMRSSGAALGLTMVEYDNADIIKDYPEDSMFRIGFFARQTYRTNSILQFLSDMEKIRQDPDIDAVLFRNQRFITSYANITEISRSLDEIRKAGKKIYFYSDNISSLPYALAASAADEIFISPAGSVNLKGFSRTGLYMKEFLEQIGIKIYNFKSHDYKTAFNSLSESGMSEYEREALDYFYTSLQEELENLILKGRKDRIKGEIADLIDKGPYLSSEKALAAGLVDKTMYMDELSTWIKNNRYKPVRYSMFPKMSEYDWDYITRPAAAVIYASGNIIRGTGIKGEVIGSESIAAAIRSARENMLVKVIILRIDSGGGSALASDLIAREVALCREGSNPKPVIVSMGGAAASGGYYIAAPADHIFAEAVTVTGSIGVIAFFPDFSGLLDILKIRTETVRTSESGDFGNPLRPMSERETDKISDYIAGSYNQFISLVSKYRKMDKEEIHRHAQGRIWTGSQAKERGLIDSTGGIMDAVYYAEEKYNTGKELRIIEIVPGRSFFSVRGFTSSASYGSAAETPYPPVMQETLKEIFDFMIKAEYYREGEPLYMLPYTIKELGLAPDKLLID